MMRASPVLAMVAALTLFLSAIPAQSQDALKYVFIPSDELFINWDKIWSARQRLPQPPAVHAYANTTNDVLQAWCHDISFQRDAMAITTTAIMQSAITNCPAQSPSELTKITVTANFFSDDFGAYVTDDMSESINIYLRSTTEEGREQLFSLAKPFLLQAYREQREYLGPQGFFRNFCRMCGCCYEPDGTGGYQTEDRWERIRGMQ